MKPRPDKAQTEAWLARRRQLMARLESRFSALDEGLAAMEEKLRQSGLGGAAEAPAEAGDAPSSGPGKPR